jgi:hypothetical protein
MRSSVSRSVTRKREDQGEGRKAMGKRPVPQMPFTCRRQNYSEASEFREDNEGIQTEC